MYQGLSANGYPHMDILVKYKEKEVGSCKGNTNKESVRIVGRETGPAYSIMNNITQLYYFFNGLR